MEEGYVKNKTPNWAELDIELSCPRCGYNLRMLTLPRCPECGLQFRWDELIRAKEEFDKRPPIFDYHWRDHPIRSFALTIWMCLQPWRLWRWLPLTAVPSVRVMPFLFVLVATILVLVSLSGDYIWDIFIKYYFKTFRGQTSFSGFPWRWKFTVVVHEVAAPSLMVFTIWMLIQIFRQTIARYRIQQSHILRIVIFTWIGMVSWQFLGEFVLTLLAMPYRWFFHSYFYMLPRIFNVIPLVILYLSLGFGFQSYLHVRGGWLWALLLMVFTFILIIIVGFIISVVILDTFNNTYWQYLTDWAQPFSLLRDLSEWTLRILHGY